jgi:predicted extracellular nuclease
VGDRLLGPVVGLLDYSGSTYKVLPSRPLPAVSRASLPRQAATLRADDRTLACAALNLQCLTTGNSRDRIADLAETIVRALHSPQIVALSGMQDDSGAADDGTASSEKNARALLEAIRAAGGPATYRWRDIAPVNNGDGGLPGANVRSGFLYDRQRVQLVERMGGNSRTPVLVRGAPGRPELSFSPGLIGIEDPAFRNARKPLAAEFLFRGQRLFVIATDLTSRSGDSPDFGRTQPTWSGGETPRLEQARALQQVAAAILSHDRDADVIVLGGLGDPAHAPSVQALKGTLLFDLAEQRLAPQERYTCVSRGNSIDLDHILVSKSLLNGADARVEIVHRYSEYPPESRHGDHDPVMASFQFR